MGYMEVVDIEEILKEAGIVEKGIFYGLEEIKPAFEGKIVAICAKHGETVQKGEIIAFVE